MRAIRPGASFRAAGPGATVPAQRGSERPDAQRRTLYRIDWDGLRTAGRACCCPARPTVMAIIPPAPGREHRTDLLLCTHHFRVSRDALIAAGALMLGPDRTLIAPGALPCLPAG